MRRILIFLILIALIAFPACAGTYESDCGYTVKVPDGWSVMTRDYTESALSSVPDAIGLDMFLAEDRESTLTVLIYNASGAKTRELPSLLSPGEGSDDFEDLGIKSFGGRDWYCVRCLYAGERVNQAFCTAGDRLFGFTFKGITDTELIGRILASFEY